MYNREKAVKYALQYALYPNPDYYDFSMLGGDCTNFVSQCIYAGGVLMNFNVNGWYYLNLANRAPAWSGVNEFWSFAINNKGVGVKLAPCEKFDLQIGDVVQLFNGIKFYHNLIVTDKFGDNIRVSAHDYNVKNVSLQNYNLLGARFGKIFT